MIVTEEVADALAEGQPTVALESTLIAHGLPQPSNLDTAVRAELAVRDAGAVPATIAVLGGSLRVGLTSGELEELASTADVAKVSLRDIGSSIIRQTAGATTVAATMFAAHRAGIRIFSTGGIGGIHRGRDGDVSADLTALATIPVAVICAGAKAILDLPRTVEALETLGIPTLGFLTNAFPEFWSPGKHLPVSTRVDSPSEVADILEAHWSSGLTSGVVVATPVPTEYAIDSLTIEHAVVCGLNTATEEEIQGSELTPFLLAEVAKVTNGASLEANIALVINNARIAGGIAAAFTEVD